MPLRTCELITGHPLIAVYLYKDVPVRKGAVKDVTKIVTHEYPIVLEIEIDLDTDHHETVGLTKERAIDLIAALQRAVNSA